MTVCSYLNIGGALFGFAAAYFWYQSAMVEFPKKLSGYVIDPITVVNTTDLSEAICESARKNKIAAFMSAVSMVFAGASAIISSASDY